MRLTLATYVVAMITKLLLTLTIVAAGCTTQPAPTTTATTAEPSIPALTSTARVSMSVTDGPIGFESSYRMTREAGVDATSLTVFWDDIESSPGTYDPDPNFLSIADEFYSAEDVSIGLTIAVVDTTEIRMPSDLEGREFDDPEVIERFRSLLDWVGTQLPSVELDALSIGNEVDIALGASGSWGEYDRFLAAVIPHARTVFPDVPIGVKTTLNGYETRREVASLHAHADVAMLTHYLIGDDFNAQAPASVNDAFASAVELSKGKPVMFLELGYPSADSIGGTEQDQARFVQESFVAMDRFPEVTLVEFSWSTDISQESVADYEEYYGLPDEGFAAYLGSLGFIRSDGTPKPAYTTLATLLKG